MFAEALVLGFESLRPIIIVIAEAMRLLQMIANSFKGSQLAGWIALIFCHQQVQIRHNLIAHLALGDGIGKRLRKPFGLTTYPTLSCTLVFCIGLPTISANVRLIAHHQPLSLFYSSKVDLNKYLLVENVLLQMETHLESDSKRQDQAL